MLTWARVGNKSGSGEILHCECPSREQENQALIASKGRLVPLKAITIPRLEPTAAVTAVQLEDLIRSSLDIECMPSTFWTDSKMVLAYLQPSQKI